MMFYWSRTGASTSNFAKRCPKLLTRLSQLIIKFLIANAKSNQPAKLQLSSKKNPKETADFQCFTLPRSGNWSPNIFLSIRCLWVHSSGATEFVIYVHTTTR